MRIFREAPSCSSHHPPAMMPAGAHRTQPRRTPDARSCRVSARDRSDALPLRPCEGTVHGIAHRVKPGWQVAGHSGRRWGSQKCGRPPRGEVPRRGLPRSAEPAPAPGTEVAAGTTNSLPTVSTVDGSTRTRPMLSCVPPRRCRGRRSARMVSPVPAKAAWRRWRIGNVHACTGNPARHTYFQRARAPGTESAWH